MKLAEKVLKGFDITRSEALELIDYDIEILSHNADQIRQQFCGNSFDICSIINGKSGRCTEDCKYCAQSSHYFTKSDGYELLDKEKITERTRNDHKHGTLRFSVVTSGKCLSDSELEKMCETYKYIRKTTKVALCASHGLLKYEQMVKLKKAGVSRYHCNLESSERLFTSICSTHTYEDKIRTIKNAQQAGLSVCSGGIIGMGETFIDRIDMAFQLKDLGIRSVPINILVPIPGTPFEKLKPISKEDVRRTAAIFRFILPQASVRLAGGRGTLDDKGESVFISGANAAISGNMLTTSGITIETDISMIQRLRYKAEIFD